MHESVCREENPAVKKTTTSGLCCSWVPQSLLSYRFQQHGTPASDPVPLPVPVRSLSGLYCSITGEQQATRVSFNSPPGKKKTQKRTWSDVMLQVSTWLAAHRDELNRTRTARLTVDYYPGMRNRQETTEGEKKSKNYNKRGNVMSFNPEITDLNQNRTQSLFRLWMKEKPASKSESPEFNFSEKLI